jgi:hypothetical protein
MADKTNCFDPNAKLMANNIIKTAGSDLYRIGLSHYRIGYKKRRKIFNPTLNFIFSIILWMKFIMILIYRPVNKEISIMIGDFAYFLGIRVQFNLATSQSLLLSLISQILHYWQYKRNQYPTYMKPFLMLSGFVSPKRIGLTDKQYIFKLINYSKSMLNLTNCILLFAPFVIFIFTFYPLAINSGFTQLLIFSLPWSLLFAFFCISCSLYNSLANDIFYNYMLLFEIEIEDY